MHASMPLCVPRMLLLGVSSPKVPKARVASRMRQSDHISSMEECRLFSKRDAPCEDLVGCAIDD